MRGVAIGSQGVSNDDNYVITIGVSGEQAGYSTFIGIGSITKTTYRGQTLRNIFVENRSAEPADYINVAFVGAQSQNLFKRVIFAGINNALILLDSSTVFDFQVVGVSFTTWSWRRGYRSTWPENSFNGLKRAFRFS